MRLPRLAALALLLAVVPACSGASSPEPGPPPPPVAAGEFNESYADAICEHQGSCLSQAPYLVEQCKVAVLAALGEDPPAAIAAGRMVYSAAEAGRCVAGLRAQRCTDDQPDDDTTAACLAALKGTVATGEPCFGPFECEAGVCPSTSEGACPARCPMVGGEGGACSLLAGQDCDARQGLKCMVDHCVKPGETGATCADNNGCKSGLVCVGGKCTGLRELHQGCARDASCADGLFCVAAGDGTKHCDAQVAAGGACGQDTAQTDAVLRSVQCVEGLLCKGAGLKNDGTSLPGACAKPAAEGEACTDEPADLQQWLSGCQDGLLCVGGTCQKPPTSGACAAHYTCQPGAARCDAMNTCVALLADGADCKIDPECASGYCGPKGKCAAAVTFCGP